MGMTFYYAPMSSATRVHWALEEIGAPYEKVRIDLSKGDQRKPEYLALNPNGKVPLLVVDGQPIFESLAILLYLADRFGADKGLFPTAPAERAEALKWMCWGSVSLGEALSRYLRNSSDRFPADERNAKTAESAKNELGQMLGIIDKGLAGQDYLVGSSFTLVDCALASLMPFLQRLGIDLDPHKNINAWVSRCITRPALGRAMAG